MLLDPGREELVIGGWFVDGGASGSHDRRGGGNGQRRVVWRVGMVSPAKLSISTTSGTFKHITYLLHIHL